MDKILGFEKLSLVDYDGYVSCTVFTGNCNFKCPFCHNSILVLEYKELEEIKKEEVLNYLKDRKKMLDAVCISGGEPTLYKGLVDLIDDIKKLGYSVKLDTNGSNYDVLKYLIDNKKIDYVAMDVKNGIKRYYETIGISSENNNLLKNVLKSIELLKGNVIDYEFRTTLVNELHSLEDIKEMGELLKGSKKLFLQKFVDKGSCIKDNLHEVSSIDALKYKEELEKYIDSVNLRGY